MDRKLYLKKIISEFEDWWVRDPHSSNMDFYQNTITATRLSSLSNKEFVDFFYDFVSEGGRVQSGGDRTKNRFRDTVEKNIDKFRKFICNYSAKKSIKDRRKSLTVFL